MFSFFKKSKKDENGKKCKEVKNSSPGKDNHQLLDDSKIDQSTSNDEREMCKNTQPSTPELAPDTVTTSLPKNVLNAAKTIGNCEVATFSEKNNDPNDSKMCDPYVNGLKVNASDANRLTQRRGSNVKPCGHGTTAILPRVPPQNARPKKEAPTPPESPIMEVKKTFRYTVNGIEGNDRHDFEKNTKKEKEFENVVIARLPNGGLEESTVQDEYVILFCG